MLCPCGNREEGWGSGGGASSPSRRQDVGGMLRTTRISIAVVSAFYGRSRFFVGNAPEDGFGVRRDILRKLDQVQMGRLMLRRLDPRDG